MYSYHIFLFPFKWEILRNKKSESERNSMSEKYRLSDLDKELKKTKWNRDRTFNLDYKDCYNEYNFFYRQVREILYEQSGRLIEEKTESGNDLIKHYEYDIPEGMHYCIKLNCGKKYYLEIDSILLNIYSTGTGVISFHLRNCLHKDAVDILKINQYGRRLFPPFLALNDSSILTKDKDNTSNEEAINGVKNVELPDAIWLGEENSLSSDYYENFERYSNKEYYEKGPFRLPKFIEKLFDGIKVSSYKRDLCCGFTNLYIDTVLDDRMFVISWYGNNDIADNFKNKSNDTTGNYLESDFWYKYVFVDGENKCIQNYQMQRNLIEQATYTRWIDYGTLWGVSRYSFVCLTSEYDKSSYFIIKHIQSMYYKMVELCLLQRGSVLSYSEELARVVNSFKEKSNKTKMKDVENNLKQVRDLYDYFMLFKNKMCFVEVTAQEQGIEIYDMLQSAMKVPQELDTIEKKMNDIYNYTNLIQQTLETEEVGRLTKVMFYLALPALVVGIYSMSLTNGNISEYVFSSVPYWPFWIGLVTVVVFSCLAILLFKKFIIKN